MNNAAAMQLNIMKRSTEQYHYSSNLRFLIPIFYPLKSRIITQLCIHEIYVICIHAYTYIRWYDFITFVLMVARTNGVRGTSE